ncbi:MAG: excinuclease ABC subunit UvrA, partial [Bacteroidales bacterium]|nr:excinuclease ABC subunit UvrA [Bacteroidales bacterium]
MVKYSEKQIIQEIESCYNDSSIIILAPVVKGRKGHYRELFESITKKGFLKVRIDGKIENLVSGLRVDRYKVHDIEIVIDKLKISSNGKQERLKKSIETAFKHGKNSLMIIDENEKIRHFSRLLMCPTTGISYPEPEPNTFSFNSPYGACPFCNGLGEVTQVEIDKIIPDRKKSIANGGLIPIGKPNMNSWFVKQISQIGISYDFSLDTAFEDYTEQALNVLLYGECKDSAMPNDFKGVVNFIASQFNEESVPASIQKWAASFMSNKTCPHCNGRRLKEESLHFRIGDKNIADLANMDLTELSQWCIRIEVFLSPREKEIASEILREINTKISFLLDVGLGYLSLNRSTRSLSGGESQRIRLATQIGSKLVNVMYILDEPSIGLHQTDNIRLIESLKRLRDLGNTVIVVEHDKDMMLASDYIIDIGPGAGINGGQLTAIGSPKDILNQNSITCQYLKGEKKIPIPE